MGAGQISFCGPEERPLLHAIETLIGTRIPARTEPATSSPQPAAAASKAPRGARNAQRNGRRKAPSNKPAAPAGHGPALDNLPFMRDPSAPRRGRRPAGKASRPARANLA